MDGSGFLDPERREEELVNREDSYGSATMQWDLIGVD